MILYFKSDYCAVLEYDVTRSTALPPAIAKFEHMTSPNAGSSAAKELLIPYKSFHTIASYISRVFQKNASSE